MPEKANGDYYYVESETVNDLIDDFAFYGDGSGNLVIHDQSNDDEYKFTSGTGLELPAGRSLSVGGSPVVSDPVSLTDNTVTATDGTLADVSTTSTAVDANFKEIYEVLAAHGLVA